MSTPSERQKVIDKQVAEYLAKGGEVKIMRSGFAENGYPLSKRARSDALEYLKELHGD